MSVNLENIIKQLKQYQKKIKIMEVCGTHTSAIFKTGTRTLLGPEIQLVSGPGCPVCCTSAGVIDALINYAKMENTTVLSFGDMFRVTGTVDSISTAKASGASVQLMYSPFEALKLAKENADHNFIVAAVGFETTISVYAALLEQIIAQGLKNIKLYTALKTMSPVLDYVCAHEQVEGFLCPGHVSVIIGSHAYEELCDKYKKPFVIAGFEAEHILAAVYEIINQHEKAKPSVKNLYTSVVRPEGHKEALVLISKYFNTSNANWRGIGMIADSGLVLKPEYSDFSANVPEEEVANNDACLCSDVILGRITPDKCSLFQKMCTPQEPIGACMVSSEGACRIWNDFSIRRSDGQ